MPQITGIKEVIRALTEMSKDAKKDDRVTVIVGFTQSYAVWVHENLQAQHKVGQAKFLESPARSLRKEFVKLIRTTTQKTGNIRDGLLIAGLRLQREAQKLTPVDTGALRASAFTAFEEDSESEARKAFKRSEALKK